ncbi:hypothetical protein M5K25_023530 [Dendrobium thyrsiflorum]|uniref:Uncharacterized protein n=1 Tax=Dendrobium thyrsiflorum TaxID=117978 RepID=A0ABD0U8K7_DENTH
MDKRRYHIYPNAPPPPPVKFLITALAGIESTDAVGFRSSRSEILLSMERTRGCHISTHLGCFTPRSSPSHDMGEGNEHKQYQVSSSLDMDWKCATCAVCMEPPHNAILLLCSSHEKGCRPYMCNTSYQQSNCLELFKKAFTVSVSTNQKTLPQHSSAICNKSKVLELPCPQCPLCRGQVKGWTVIGPARKYLDNKRRSCMQDECSFVGTLMELKQHIRENHPFPRPLEVDPELEKKWRELELERERQDVLSFISSSMPNSVILGDYVIDQGELHNSLDNGFLYGAEHRVYRDLQDFYYHRTTNVPRGHRHRRRRRRRRIQGRWMFGFRPFLARWNWMYH